MTKKAAMILAAVGVLAFAGCRSKKPAGAEAGKEWYRYISAFTSGTISRKSPVRVLFVDNAGRPGPAAPDLFEFTPAIAGTAEWAGPRELVFRPGGELKPGQEYKAVLRVGRILDLPRAFARFEFRFGVVKPSLEVTLEGLFAEDPARPQAEVLRGRAVTSDMEEKALVEKVLEAEQDGRALPIEWSHSPEGLSHSFAVKDVVRKEEASAVNLSWDGAPLRIDDSGRRDVAVPAQGAFEVLTVEPVPGETKHVLVRFSDLLAPDQSLKGLIKIGDLPLTFEVEGNVVRIYSTGDFAGTMAVEIQPGIRNYLGKRLKDAGPARQVTFESISPQVRFVGRGLILPRRDRLTVPIEAVNLKSVQVAAFQIYPGNMAQFFQVNSLEGSEELARVGRYLWRKTIALSEDPAVTGRWSRYDLDVTPLFKESPGSLFRLVLSFNRGNSTFPCAAGGEPVVTEPPLRNMDDASYARYSDWDYSDEGYDYNPGDWARRDDPCSNAYYIPRYNRQAVVGRSFFSSDIGLTAKLGENGALHVVTTDIGTARPVAGLRVRAFNYQNQVLGEATSDANGFAVFALKDRAFYVSAEGGGDTGYLRLAGEGALPLSHFDVGGEVSRKGVKGILYGERGVWRPGDTLHLTFALFDRQRSLPAGHPVLLELANPQGQVVLTAKPDKVVEPFYAFKVETDEAAPTGNWQARVLVGGLTFSKTLKIETVVPNRLKITIDAGRDFLVRRNMPFEAAVSSQWLHGAPAANLRFDISVRLSRRPTRFDRYPDYSFDDPARDFEGATVEAAKGTLDAQGRARARIDIDPRQPSPGLLEAAFTSRVFEESGDFSVDSFSLPFHPYDGYVGVRAPKGDQASGMLLTDKDQVVSIVTVDTAGRPVSRGKVLVSLYKIEWKWWWDRSGESLAQYVSSVETRPLLKGEVATRNGAGQWTFQIRYPDWGRYLIRVEDPESGHASGQIVYVDWPGWAGRAREEGGAGATALTFTADKPSYKVGEKAVIYLPEAVQGRALVSLESGTSVLDKFWVSTVKGENRFEVPITAAMTPNIYAHVMLLQPHRDKAADTPIRLYGVIPIIVEDPGTRLEPKIKMADEIRPREKFRVEVRETEGRPMSYTLAVVDEGLLGLTRFTTPDLRRGFYAREALGVKTWDLFDIVAEAYGAEMARILALGGDEGGESKDKAKQPRRFPPVALFEGPFDLAAGGTGVHEMTMPQYFGAVRIMVVAGRDGAFGLAEKSVTVRRDLMTLATLPRVVRPGEDVVMPVTVFVTKPEIRQVTVGVETNALFEVVGERAKTVAFAKPGDEIVSFALKTAGGIGQGEVRFRASGGAERVEDTIAIPVLASNTAVTQTTRLTVKPGESVKRGIVPFGLEGTNQVVVEASSVPPLDLERRLDFLIRYPHGCLEQTLSAAFPQLYLKSLVKLDERQARDVDGHVRAAVEKMTAFQMTNGAFSYWPGNREAHEWTTAYAGYFLLEAGRLGYHVPQAMLDAWRANQKMLANAYVTGGGATRLTQAFRLFGLALARDPDLGAMNRLRESEDLPGLAALMLAAAFHVTGQADAAADLADRAKLEFKPYRDYDETFGSDFRDKALAVRTFVQMGRSDKARALVADIGKTMGSDLWLSTQDASFGLMALASFYGSAGIKPFRYRLAWDEDKALDVESATPFDRREFPSFPLQGRTLTVTNTEAADLYVSVYRRGVPEAGVETPSSEGLSIDVSMRDMKMNGLEIGRIAQGLDLVAEVRVKNLTSNRLPNLVLTHLVAAGFQIKNPRFAGEGGAAEAVDYQDIRDDRVYTYFGLDAGQVKTFLVVLNASYRGRYYQPGLAVEAMYDAGIHANTKGQWVEISQ
ncbi:MAG TPA: MG2 domain-containing protein [Candidatus Aminicenantes bacterium]|nr:MG2 domain-containing protein [Candidatus Aminicenantes bacterium]HRY63710.1 MG2 domain-containing protein [Candidatus Aminicenantes bacterium]HRZ73258.1 MG2 domain-containing protein [Candidatus Aminicenantes bacterium]